MKNWKNKNMGSYDQQNKIRDKYNSIIKQKDDEIAILKQKLEKAETTNNELRRKLFDAGEGKGDKNRLERIITAQERNNKTLENQIKNLDGSKLISSFKPERQELIYKIKKLSFKNRNFDYLATKFKDGLDNVIEIAYRIKTKKVDDIDYYTFVFRDDIVGLLEKMLRSITGKYEDSASKYLVKIRDGIYLLPKHYYVRIPVLANITVINNILNLINLESCGYHGSKIYEKHLKTNQETLEKEHPNKFLNLDNEEQLLAIFTLLEFMYDVFTNKDHEVNLISISSSWFKTI